MKAVVLAAGLGSRMRRLDEAAALDASQESAADRGLKALVPIGGRPFLDYVLSGLADAGIADVVVVIGPSSLAIRGHYESSPPERLRLSFATQEAPRGTADALLAAELSLGAEDFLVLNSDNRIQGPANSGRYRHSMGWGWQSNRSDAARGMHGVCREYSWIGL